MPDALAFLRTFKSRRDCCRVLLDLAHEQNQLIAAEDYTQLLVVLGHKQGVLGRLEEIQARDPQLWPSWRGERTRLSPADRQACETVLAETESLLAELYELETAGTTDLARRRDATRRDLQTLSTGHRAHDAYAETGSSYQTLNIHQ